jgi:putative glutamine amidotransferase
MMNCARTTTQSPLIGVTTKLGEPERAKRSTRNYMQALQEAGAIGVILSPDAPARFPDGTSYLPDTQGRLPAEVLRRLDGLVLSGGGDVDPKYFGEALNGANPRAIHVPRDELELALSRQALEEDVPVFGVCRGCQVLNVAAGGGMLQHFDGHRSPRENPFYHDVLIERGSRLHGMVNLERLPTNTYHHQGMDHATLSPTFAPTGLADPDVWLIEAFESQAHRWIVGVQWHPERLFELDDAHRLLWRDFVQACAK